MKRAILLLAGLLLGTPAFAVEYYFESRTWQEGDRAAAAAEIEFRGYGDGARLSIEIVESGNPFMRAGHRLVSEDVMEEILLVDDESRNCSAWNLDQILNATATILRGMGPLLSIKIENPEVATLERASAGMRFGHAAERVVTQTDLDMVVRVMGMKNRQHLTTVDEMVLLDLGDPGLVRFTNREPPDFGEEFSKLWELEKQKRGDRLVVEQISRQTSYDKKGRPAGTVETHSRIEKLEQRAAPPGSYSCPDGYSRNNLMPTAEELEAGESGEQRAGEEESGQEEKKGWRSRLPWKKKGGA